MKLPYERIEYNTLLSLLNNIEYNEALAFMIDYKVHQNLKVVPKQYSIEISSNEITIIVILFVGFEQEEYKEIKNRKNLHIVSFADVVPDMTEFRELNVKFIDKHAWLFTILSRSNKPIIKELNSLKNLAI